MVGGLRCAADERVAEPDLGDLPLVHLFVHRADGEQAVDEARLGLPVAVDARHRLPVRRRVPVAVEQHEPVRAGQVEPDAARARAQQEDEGVVGVVARRAVELAHELRARILLRLAVEAQRGEVVLVAVALEQVERRGEVGHDNHAVARVLPHGGEQRMQHGELAALGARRAAHGGAAVHVADGALQRRRARLGARVGVGDELGRVTQLAEQRDERQVVALLAERELVLYILGAQRIQLALDGRHAAEQHGLVWVSGATYAWGGGSARAGRRCAAG